MDCRAALEILDCVGPGGTDLPPAELQAATEHVAGCRRCASIVQRRRSLDRKIGRVVREVEVPEGALDRLLAVLAALDAVPAAQVGRDDESVETVVRGTNAAGANAWGAGGRPIETSLAQPARDSGSEIAGVAQRRRYWKGLVPLSACVLVAAVAFFGVVWLLTPRWTVDDVRHELAKLDFDALQVLPDFNGATRTVAFPDDASWDNLEWCCGAVPKGAPPRWSQHVFGIYGFVLHDGRHAPIKGLLAVIPRSRVRGAPAADSLAAVPASEYVPDARLGESVSVAWTSGECVCVVLVRGGADSLSLLQQRLGMPAA